MRKFIIKRKLSVCFVVSRQKKIENRLNNLIIKLLALNYLPLNHII